MKIQKIQNNNQYNPNFNGFQNAIISGVADSKSKQYFWSITTQLNNIGNNDLTIWKKVQKTLLKRVKPSNVLTINLMERPEEKSFSIAEKVLKPKRTQYSKKQLLETYNWLSDLTKRMCEKEKPFLRKDENFIEFYLESVRNIAPFFGNNLDEAKIVLVNGLLNTLNDGIQGIAEHFHQEIQDTIKNFPGKV